MVTTGEIIFRLLYGALIGGIIGIEREIHGRAAGLRTQLIVCVASVLIMIVSENYYFKLLHMDPLLRIDPARIAAGALIGIGFLGAGVIVKSGFAIRGLTTAASIWIVSAIGLAIGGGLYLEATVTSAITVIALVLLRRLEKILRILVYRTITVSTLIDDNSEETLTAILKDFGIRIHSIDYEKISATEEYQYNFSISTRDKSIFKDVFFKLGALDFVKTVKIDSGERLTV